MTFDDCNLVVLLPLQGRPTFAFSPGSLLVRTGWHLINKQKRSILNGGEKMDQKELIVLLNKSWMSHDGMWFMHCCREFGIEAGNRLNKAAISSLAPLEIARYKKELGFDDQEINTFDQFKAFFTRAAELVIPDVMGGRFAFEDGHSLSMEMTPQQCFAYKGMQRMGVIDQYECGVIYRIECWLDALGIKFQTDPDVTHCTMHTEGHCVKRIRLSFD